jgi:hypothetical protein
LQLQAVADALGYAAQRMQADALEAAERETAAAASALSAACQAQAADDTEALRAHIREHEQHRLQGISETMRSQYWYGVFQGYRGLLRAVEGNIGELEQVEREMLDRINLDHDPPFFSIPGFEQVQGGQIEQHLPGENPS